MFSVKLDRTPVANTSVTAVDLAKDRETIQRFHLKKGTVSNLFLLKPRGGHLNVKIACFR
jgi:hypothetical protein